MSRTIHKQMEKGKRDKNVIWRKTTVRIPSNPTLRGSIRFENPEGMNPSDILTDARAEYILSESFSAFTLSIDANPCCPC